MVVDSERNQEKKQRQVRVKNINRAASFTGCPWRITPYDNILLLHHQVPNSFLRLSIRPVAMGTLHPTLLLLYDVLDSQHPSARHTAV